MILAETEAIVSESGPAFEDLQSVLEESEIAELIEGNASFVLSELSAEDLPEYETALMMSAGYGTDIVHRMVRRARRSVERRELRSVHSLLSPVQRALKRSLKVLTRADKKEPPVRFRIQRGVVEALGKIVAGGLAMGGDLSLGALARSSDLLTPPTPGMIGAAVAILGSICTGIVYGSSGIDHLVSHEAEDE